MCGGSETIRNLKQKYDVCYVNFNNVQFYMITDKLLPNELSVHKYDIQSPLIRKPLAYKRNVLQRSCF